MKNELCYANNPYGLFRKYEKLVTWFANTQLGRDYLKHNNFYIPREKIGLFLPNGYHIIKEVGKKEITFQATFTTHAVYSPKLTQALRAVDLVSSWINHFDEAKELLVWYLGLRKQPLWASKALYIHFLTLTFNPNADPETTSVDGDIFRGTTESWAAKREATDGTTVNPSATTNWVGYLAGGASPNWANMIRSIFLFDTSSLPDNAEVNVSGTKIRLFVGTNDTTFDYGGVRIVTSTPASNTDVVIGDFDQIGTVAQATDIVMASLTVSAYNDFNFNATGVANISLTGVSKFGTRGVKDADNAEPAYPGDGIDAGCNVNSADNAANKPELTVVYTLLSTNEELFGIKS